MVITGNIYSVRFDGTEFHRDNIIQILFKRKVEMMG